MSFLYPAFLLGALAVAMPIALHFLRRDVAPEVPFTAVRLLRSSPVARSRRRRLRDLLLLAARVGALLLLAAAFARPYVAGASASSTMRIVALDRSFSMDASGRFARALDVAGRAIDEAGVGDQVALIAFDDRADLVAPPGTAAAARAALAALRPGFGGTRYRALLTKAAEVAGASAARLVIVSDLQRAGWEGEGHAVLPSNVAVDLRDRGGPPMRNVSVAAVRPAADRVVASVRNAGPAPRSGEVRIDRDGHTVASARYVAQPGTSVDVPIAYRTPGHGSIAVSVDDPDGFASDNTRFVVLDPQKDESALLVTSGASESGFYLARALGSAAAGGDQRFDTRLTTSATMPHDGLAGYSAVVLLSTRGLERRARESLAAFVRSGGGLLIAASPDVDAVVLSTTFDWQPALKSATESGEATALSVTDLRHPVFRPFGILSANLGQVRFERSWQLDGKGWDVTARFTDGSPALLERREGQGRIVLFASDVDRKWNDFPLHPSFVPFGIEAVRYVAGRRDRGAEYVSGTEPEGAEGRPGVYRAKTDGRMVAVNVDSAESGTDVMRPDEFTAMIESVSPAAGAVLDPRARLVEARQSYWQYGLLLMLAALIAESFMGRA